MAGSLDSERSTGSEPVLLQQTAYKSSMPTELWPDDSRPIGPFRYAASLEATELFGDRVTQIMKSGSSAARTKKVSRF